MNAFSIFEDSRWNKNTTSRTTSNSSMKMVISFLSNHFEYTDYSSSFFSSSPLLSPRTVAPSSLSLLELLFQLGITSAESYLQLDRDCSCLFSHLQQYKIRRR